MWLLVSGGGGGRARGVLAACLLLTALILVYGASNHLVITREETTDKQVNQAASGSSWLLLADDDDDAGDTNRKDTFASASQQLTSSMKQQKQQEESFIASGNVNGSQVGSGRSRRRIRRLVADRRPILNEFLFPANLVQGMRFVLMCQVLDGDLPIQIKWFRDQSELVDSSTVAESASQKSTSDLEVELLSNDELGSSLLFRKVQQKHSGNYTCLAKNHHGSTSYSSSLSVKIPPKWRLEPQDQAESIIGEQATIDCQAEGNPNPFIRWKFSPATAATNPTAATTFREQQHPNGLLMGAATSQPPEATFKLINSNHHIQSLENGSLAIRSIGKEDEGFYQCEADNGLEPSLSKWLRLVVRQQAQIIDDLRLSGSPFSSSESAGPSALSGNLPVIRSVRLQQTNSTTTTTTTTTSQQQLRVLCQLVGDLPLTVDWLKDEQLIYTHTIQPDHSTSATSGQTAATDRQLGRLHVNTRRSGSGRFESELYLAGVRRSDAGLFSCSARNAFGRGERRMKLLLQEVPEPPEVVDVSRIGSRTIGLRWLPSSFDGNSPIVKYLVEYRRLPSFPDPNGNSRQQPTDGQPDIGGGGQAAAVGQSERIMQTPADQQQQQQAILHTVRDLEPLARYSMRVIAVNAIGRSRPSVALTLRTEEEVPSVVADSLVVIVLSSRSVKLHWTLAYPLEREIIDGFFIGYKSATGPTSGSPSLLPPPPPFDQIQNPADQQLPSQQSPMTAAAQSGAGDLQQQPPTYTYKTVRLSRAAAEQQEPGSAYISPLTSTTKTISSQPSSDAIQQQQQVVSSTFEYVIGGLERNTEYSIIIQCFNKKGVGPASDTETFRTFANDPPEKLLLSADEISESSVRVNWRFMSAQLPHATLELKHHNQQQQQQQQQQQLVDGFVLSFAKVISGGKATGSEVPSPARQLLPVVVAAARIASQYHQPQQQLMGANLTVEQWQSIQLAPQQRSHQLKNLECGTSYAMKIWAFNKIGKGEPSDQVTVSTRGKAPIAPDRRSFLSINSTQVRLHLSAWYDGGCEIDKFTVQYRQRAAASAGKQQQQEWTLVSNNILREQLSVVIRDLSPATGYELLVGAQNQVGLTEVKYRFLTLDSDGKQVAGSSVIEANSFASSSADGDSVGDSLADYAGPDDGNAGSSTRREYWPSGGGDSLGRSMLFVRQFMNSPLALVMSLCFFVVLLLVLIFYAKFNAQQDQSSSSASTLNLNPHHHHHHHGGGNKPLGEQSIMVNNHGDNGDLLAGGGGSQTMTDCTDSPLQPRMQPNQQSIRLLSSNYSPAPTESCHYQPFCNPSAVALSANQSQDQIQQHYSHHYGLPNSTAFEATNSTAPLGQIYSGLPAPQRSATMDQVSAGQSMMMQADQERSRQLMQMQMLMLQQQRQQNCLDQIPENQPTAASYAATLARVANNTRGTLKLNNQNHPFQSNSSTLGRQPTNCNNNNNFLEQTRGQSYAMSTFKQAAPAGQLTDGLPEPMMNETQSCSTATSSTSGRGTTTQPDLSTASGSTDNNCDTKQTSPYDVPFKFSNSGGQTATVVAANNNGTASNNICY